MSAPSPELQARAVGMGAVIALGALVVLARSWPRPAGPEVAIVEVRGAVPAPGFYELPTPATLGQALHAAGAPDGALEGAAGATQLEQGDRVTLSQGTFEVSPSDAALTLGRPLDLNRASQAALEQLQGVGPARAAAIIADREARGPFPDIDALDRVRGFGPATVERLRPFLVVGPATPPTR